MASGGLEDLQIDNTYEFCAPKFFDFNNEETEDDIKRAELWFKRSLSYAPSPFMPRIRESRSIQIDNVCNLGDVDHEQKVEVPTIGSHQTNSMTEVDNATRNNQHELANTEVKDIQDQEVEDKINSFELVSEVPCETNIFPSQKTSLPCNNSSPSVSEDEVPSFESSVAPSGGAPIAVAPSAACTSEVQMPKRLEAPVIVKDCRLNVLDSTPRAQKNPVKGVAPNSAKNSNAKKIANLLRQTSALKPKSNLPSKSLKSTHAKNGTKCPSSLAAKNSAANQIAEENQAVKRQKLDDGKSKQIHNVKNRMLNHKSRLGIIGGLDMFSSSGKDCQDEKSLQKEVQPYISALEMVNKFQSRTRDLDLFQKRSLSHEDTASVIQRRPKLTLTRPKDPKLETAQRVRVVRIKSSAELEEEMLAKIPKFKARPLNKKILDAPACPALIRRMPQPPVFQEFHFKTMERANQHAETSSIVSSIDTSVQNQIKPLKLTEPRCPHLETSIRARPPKIRSSQELELEELEKIPKFKARPLNKKILESKGEIGLSCNPKPPITIPREFHFATDDRLGPPATVVDLFDKLSLHSRFSNHDNEEVPRVTIPNPFHLRTEERGLEKERHFEEQLLQKELEDKKAKILKAHPYPYTTDYPVLPPKPEPKQCTKPEAFQLESLARHEEEMQKKLEEKARMEKEEAQQRMFRAKPIMKLDPLPVPKRERKPLTEFQGFAMHVDHRAVQRTEFDKKIKEKESTYKRLREEQESAKMFEEEKAVKQMRRTMVPHARPLPKFDNPFVPQKSMKDATKAESPDLHVKHRVQRRRALRQMR
ncbi:protein TPX2-like isoform X1 [Canna indica]|uniref:Protein TPX2-like isoform X1 n=1 Tax=Canna indica TaxID=4628 RepID=A0AAQ3JL82_9LILI|nr:protein TPX2-like isoform X1 [Canna indica]